MNNSFTFFDSGDERVNVDKVVRAELLDDKAIKNLLPNYFLDDVKNKFVDDFRIEYRKLRGKLYTDLYNITQKQFSSELVEIVDSLIEKYNGPILEEYKKKLENLEKNLIKLNMTEDAEIVKAMISEFCEHNKMNLSTMLYCNKLYKTINGDE